MKMKTTDYLYCEDCETFCDLWKYEFLVDTGHHGCKCRFAIEEELPGLVKECESHRCFDDLEWMRRLSEVSLVHSADMPNPSRH